MEIFIFIVGVLATNGAVEVLRHDHRLENLRQYADRFDAPWFLRALPCGWCTSFWVAGVIAILSLPAFVFPGNALTTLLLFPVIVLALARGSNLVNDCLHKFLRTPGQKKD